MKQWKKVLTFGFSVVLVCVLAFGLTQIVSFGESTGVIEISTAAQLRRIGLDADKPLDGNYVLTADIDLSDKEWVGIGGKNTSFVGGYVSGSYTYFNGTFDGQGHTISGMHFGSETESKEINELWGFVCTLGSNDASAPATVKNIVFEDVYFNGHDTGTYAEVGVAAGYARYNAVIENVSVRSGKLIDRGSRQVRIGGILGAMTNGGTVVIKNCYNGAYVNGTYAPSESSSYASVGGIVGMQSKGTLTVDSCVNAGTVETFSEYQHLYEGSRVSYSKICHIVSNATEDNSLLSTTTVTNCYGLSGNLLAEDARICSLREGTGLTVLSLDDAAKAASYSALSSVNWYLADGKYPVPAALGADNATTAIIGIDTAEELRKIGNDAAYPLSGSYRLTADLDLSQIEWTPLGTFTGTFDGFGHVISNMHAGTSEAPVSQNSFTWGLFGTVDGGTVKNLAFRNISFRLSSEGGLSSLGAVCGYFPGTGGVIENVAVLSGTLHGSTTHQLGVGGIVGCTNKKSGDGFTIRNCYNGATVIAEANGGSYAVAAGVIGRAWSYKTRRIENCLNVGEIKAINAGAATSNLNLAGNIISYQGVTDPSAENATTRVNNYAIAGRLFAEGENSAIYLHDVQTSATVVNDYRAISPASFSGLLTNGSLWTVKASEDGKFYYPILRDFVDYSEQIVVNEAETEQDLNRLLDTVIPSNHLTQEGISDLISPYYPDAKITLTLNGKATFTADGSWSLKVVLTDEISVERTLVITKLPSVESLRYDFTNAETGIAAGTVTATLSDSYVHGLYELYWGTESAVLPNYAPLAYNLDGMLNNLTLDGTSAAATVRERVVIPAGATHLWLLADGNTAYKYEIPKAKLSDFGTKKYTFGILSDTHFGYSAAPGAFTNALTYLESIGANFVTVSGDFTSHGSQAEYDIFQNTYNGKFTIPLFTTLGNHDSLDWTISEGLTTETAVANMLANMTTFANPDYTGPNGAFKVTVSPYYGGRYDYTVQYGDDLFVYLGIGPNEIEAGVNNTSADKTSLTASLTADQLTWLEDVLSDSENYQNVVVMFHYPVRQSGITLYRNTEDFSGLYEILKKHPNVIHFSGHTHYGFADAAVGTILSQTLAYTKNGTDYVASNGALGYTAVHIPSNYNKNTGYVATVYEDGILLTGYDFANNQVIPHATFFVANAEAEDETEDGLKPESGDLTVKIEDFEAAGKVYSLDLLWENDDMAFDYNAGSEGTWNPQDHTFEGAVEEKWEDKDLKITVVNHSNNGVKAALEVTDTDGDDELLVTPDATEKTLPTAEGTAVAEAPTVDFILTIDGTPAGAVTNVATVTVSFTAAE